MPRKDVSPPINKRRAYIEQYTPSLYREFLVVMLALTALASLLLLLRFGATGSIRYAFLLWNLVLAWVSSLITLWLSARLMHRISWPTVIALIAWLLFLPNAFYIVSDLIHLQSTGEVSILFDAVMLFLFALVGFALGLASLGVTHTWLAVRIGFRRSMYAMLGIILLCAFAIYLGRYLRWNSWDVITNPLGILVDVSNRVVYPLDNPRTLSTTLLFFTLIASVYTGLVWLVHHVVRLCSKS